MVNFIISVLYTLLQACLLGSIGAVIAWQFRRWPVIELSLWLITAGFGAYIMVLLNS